MKKNIIWERKELCSTEFLQLQTSGDNAIANSTIISIYNEFPVKIDYKIELNNWITKKVNIEIPNLEKALFIETNTNRQWFDQNGNELSELYGAIDIDISCTPFTNSLPINRSKWIINNPQNFRMVYIKVPELTLMNVKQVYTLIKEEKDYLLFDYKSSAIHTTIKFDKNGYVLDYPNLFNRKY